MITTSVAGDKPAPWIFSFLGMGKPLFLAVLASGWICTLPAAQPASQGPAWLNLPPSQALQPAPAPSLLDEKIPTADPGTEVIQWNGKNWTVSDNRIFGARFEKFLNTSESAQDSEQQYSLLLTKIAELLAPNRITPKHTYSAFLLLAQAAEFDADARQCDAIANQISAVWLVLSSNEQLTSANMEMEKERHRLEWNSKIVAEGSLLDAPSSSDGRSQNPMQRDKLRSTDLEMLPMSTRLAEINALLKTNQLKREVAELQVKIEFQSLIVQHFLQRRFEHVVIETRFYRSLFGDGDSLLRVGEEAKSLFSGIAGMPPTVGTLDSLANDAIQDVREGVRVFRSLLKINEVASASKRLAETFLIGEYISQIRSLPLTEKRQSLAFVQQSNRLISAIEIKDFTIAETILKDLEKSTKDFDSSKPKSAIETSRTLAAAHLAKAKNAAVIGDNQTVEAELRSATEIWPLNPALAEVSGLIFSQANVQERALMDFDQLLSQKNLRQISDDKMRFIAATSMYSNKQEQLRKVLEDIAVVDGAILRAQEIAKCGDFPKAWECVESASLRFSGDNKLNQVRADLTTKASDFVSLIRMAEAQEKNKQLASSLAWFLKASKNYPSSDLARQGIERIDALLLPDAK